MNRLSAGSGLSVETGRSVLTSKADEYRAKARECEERAGQTRDPQLADSYISG